MVIKKKTQNHKEARCENYPCKTMSTLLVVTAETKHPGWANWVQKLGYSQFYVAQEQDLCKILIRLGSIDVLLSPTFSHGTIFSYRSSSGEGRVIAVSTSEIAIPDCLLTLKQEPLSPPVPPGAEAKTVISGKDDLTKLNVVYGPEILSILSSPKQLVILFGEVHQRYGPKCQGDIPIQNYLKSLAEDNPNIYFDLYLEEDFQRRVIERKEEREEGRSEAFGHLYRLFHGCLAFSRVECPVPNLRLHVIDIRNNELFDDLYMYFHIRNFHSTLNGKTIEDSKIREIVDLLGPEVQQVTDFKMEMKRQLETLALVKSEIESISPRYSWASSTLMAMFTEISQFWKKDYSRVAEDFLRAVNLYLNNIKKGSIPWDSEELYRKSVTPNVDKLFQSSAELMDLYTLARILHQFNPAFRPAMGDTVAQNAILYAGSKHIELYRRFFLDHGYITLHHSHTDQLKIAGQQCVRVPDYSQLQSWMKLPVKGIVSD